ncbi:cysteine synthase A [Isachenkonia alkalipeptolytica]|uniref:Cysteine synthase n=1 Tax=Isachenkonia alkalipeptolytica TaxID=2565777 RepID=A0AA43XL33_9CLOT|nr:cysteine synthase A [Isachenkonia alkalipeptolytica]NBG88311.1 cysteine synthase A [Isachenkonia alkalipeptolytica]
MIYQSITELVGKTPVVQLQNLPNPKGAKVYVKVESFNPSGSIKDRPALNMIEEAEKRGDLKPKGTIIEPTSGNTGIGMAMVAAAKGYRLIIIMPGNATKERISILKAYGAEVHLTPEELRMSGSIDKAKELLEEIPGSYMPNQFANPDNPKIHETTTAKEILEDFPEGLDAFVATAGTGGTISGTGKVLRKHYPDLKIYVVEAKASPVIAGGEPGPHKIVGTGPGFIPETLDRNIYDEILHITDEEAIETTKQLGQQEGILAGVSAGAAVYMALEKANTLGPDQKVLAMLPDTGERYLSMDLF